MADSHKAGVSWGFLFSLLIIAVVFGLLLLPALQRSKRVNHPLTDGQRLKMAHLAMTIYNTAHEAVPPSWMFLIYNGSIVSEICTSYYNPRGWEEREPTLGRYTVADLYGSAISVEMLTEEAGRVVPDDPWERVGDLLLSREVETQNSFRDDLIAGVTLFAHKRKRGLLSTNVMFADNHVVLITIRQDGKEDSKYHEIIEADRAAREELNMSEPPVYAALILEHTAEQKRLAAEGK